MVINMFLIDFLLKICNSIKIKIYIHLVLPYRKKGFYSCGDNVIIDKTTIIAGSKNISIGKNVYIGPYGIIYSTIAKLKIGNYVTIGPNVTIITGDHRTDVIGKYMAEIGDTEKLSSNDKDVHIMDDVWVGANVIILKGITIGNGSIIAAGAIVNTNVPSYSIFISKDKILPRFSVDELELHKKILRNKNDENI